MYSLVNNIGLVPDLLEPIYGMEGIQPTVDTNKYNVVLSRVNNISVLVTSIHRHFNPDEIKLDMIAKKNQPDNMVKTILSVPLI